MSCILLELKQLADVRVRERDRRLNQADRNCAILPAMVLNFLYLLVRRVAELFGVHPMGDIAKNATIPVLRLQPAQASPFWIVTPMIRQGIVAGRPPALVHSRRARRPPSLF